MKCKQEGCESNFGSEKYGGYCFAHARQNGLITKSSVDGIKRKMKESQQRRRSGEKQQAIDGDPRKNKITAEAVEFYHNIMNDKDIDISVLWEEMLEEDPEFASRVTRKKEMFVLWWFADSKSRLPRTIQEVAGILGISAMRIRKWMTEEWFVNEIDRNRERSNKLIAIHVDKVRNILALGGDGAAMKQFYQDVKIEVPEDEEDGLFDDMDESLLNEGKELSELGESKTGKIAIDPEDRDLQESMHEEMEFGEDVEIY